ncbi:Detected protein of unknown function [Hibiscus syriacus]|uniref:Uncharacterized protein n=1 Tax=Hibiscus syriacus TaxID=106335 RepID=A0A6A3CGQ6_HIBSY|nr:uncharacterized protein LOC120200915 [Hibiscus syriacus]KAE8726592.1 Detected protein of unknown function [Hibiscus syriacus]
MAVEDNNGSKRARVEYEDFESEVSLVPDSKFARVDSGKTGLCSPVVTYVEPDPDDGDIQSPEAKRIPEELLSILEDSDPVIEPDPEIQGLDLVIKSFEEEIMVPTPYAIPVTQSDSGESRSDLGFLLQASGDEHDLPLNFSCIVEELKFGTVNVEGGGRPGAVGFAETMGYEFPFPSYESFEFGVGGDSDINSSDNNNNRNSHGKSGDFVALGGLFDTAADISELAWRPESFSAL